MLKQITTAGIPASLIADQVSGRKKAKEKLPLYYNTPLIFFPPTQNLEQSSSQLTAEFKANFLKAAKLMNYYSCADLTGGLGVDCFFLSRVFRDVHYIDPNRSILEIAQYNHQQLGATNIQHHETTALEFLNSTDLSFDLIFVDPSRRKQGNQKVYSLSHSEPDIVALRELIFKKTDLVLVKASPLLDIQLAVKELKNVSTVIVLAVHNECKELLFLLEKNFSGNPAIRAVNIISDKQTDTFEFYLSGEKDIVSKFSGPLEYLYEPNGAILKAGAFKSIGDKYGLLKIHPSTHLYTSAKLVNNFPGRVFKIEASVKPDIKMLVGYFPDKKANVLTRNYPLSVEELKKKSGLSDGGQKYLIGFSGVEKKHLIVGQRV